MFRNWLTITFLLIAPTIAHSQSSTDKFTIGEWEGSARTDNEGRFRHCAIIATYESGTMMGFAISKDYDFLVGLANKNWQLTPGTKSSVSLYVDGRSLGSYSATPESQLFIWFNLGNNKVPFDAMRKGYRLKVRAAQKNFLFRLTGTGKALARLKQCVDRSTSLASQSKDPFAPSAARGRLPSSTKTVNPFLPENTSRPQPSSSKTPLCQ